MSLIIILSWAGILSLRSDSHSIARLQIHVQPVAEVDQRFLSFAIDMALLSGGEWWGQQTPRVSLTDPELQKWVRVLAPAYIRIGGTESDRVAYGDQDKSHYNTSEIDSATVADLAAFLRQTGLDLMFTLNAGPGVRVNGQWQPEVVEPLLKWMRDYQVTPAVFELGNEVGAFWLIFGLKQQITYGQYVQDTYRARELIHRYFPDTQLAGPANAFWPKLKEPFSSVIGSSRMLFERPSGLDIFTWHFYPSQSTRCPLRSVTATERQFLSPAFYQEIKAQAQMIRRWSENSLQPLHVWLGETGPAQCGGEKQLSDRWVSSLWWVAHMGLMAEAGQQVMVRQSLVGGDYALLSPVKGGYQPNPDYWVGVLWKQLMGTRVLSASVDAEKFLLAFSHCSPDKNHINSVVVNFSKDLVALQIPSVTEKLLHVSSIDLRSRRVILSGMPADTYEDLLQGDIPWHSAVGKHEVELDGYSMVWLNQKDKDAVCR